MSVKSLVVVAFLASFLWTGCVRTLAVSTVSGIADDGFGALTEESDLDFAQQALPGNIKLLEVMLRSDPENERLLRLCSLGYSSYALGFLEDTDRARAREFYRRGRDYGLRLLRKNEGLSKGLDGTLDDLKTALRKGGPSDVPGAFWAAFGWGGYIELSLDDMDAIGDLPRAEELMRFVLAQDSAYFYGGAAVFLGTLYGSRPKMLGGDPELSKRMFERALKINGGKFLMTNIYYARSYAVQTQNETLFQELLTSTENASLEILPEFRLANAIAQRKARLLLSKKGDLF
jgi:hypothetical protein